MSGLEIDTESRVIGKDGKLIPDLFAVGRGRTAKVFMVLTASGLLSLGLCCIRSCFC